MNQAARDDQRSRSVYVGNITFDTTEEEIREILSQAGPISNFKLMFDREAGKHKGFGFCEYADYQSAESAVRNLNAMDLHGRQLRVGPASTNPHPTPAVELDPAMQQAIGAKQIESPYGERVPSEKAPEAISRAVASLPPEEMFAVMKQMKLCIQNNPAEARQMLLQNPQLAYALLQAQIVMKIVDPQVAMAMLHRDSQPAAPSMPAPAGPPQLPQGAPGMPMPAPGLAPRGFGMIMDPSMRQRAALLGDRPNRPLIPSLLSQPIVRPPMFNNPTRPPMQQQQPQVQPLLATPQQPPQSHQQQTQPLLQQPPQQQQQMRNEPMITNQMQQQQGMGGIIGAADGGGAGPSDSAQDQEKAMLIMQVLQLTDEQIAMLPAEQRQSILVLKEQFSSNQ